MTSNATGKIVPVFAAAALLFAVYLALKFQTGGRNQEIAEAIAKLELS